MINRRILKHLEAEYGGEADGRLAWFSKWAHPVMPALQTPLASEVETGTFCHGDTVWLADLCLCAQVLNNGPFGIGL